MSVALDRDLSSGLFPENIGGFVDQSRTFNLRNVAVTWMLPVFCIVIGAVPAYTTRYFVNGDAVSYFDMAEAFRRGSWAELINFHYSPGYPILLGIIQKILGASAADELFVAKFLNLLCYVFALFSLECLLSQLKRDEEFLDSNIFSRTSWPVLRVAAYGMFLVSTLIFVRIQVVSPDMLVFGFVILTASVLVRIKNSGKSYLEFAALGCVLGLGYLTKTFFFPLAPVFLLLGGLYCESARKALPRVFAATMVFLILSAPLLVALSTTLGRFSFGESGSFNYTYFVNKKGNPVHVPEKIHDRPGIEIYNRENIDSTYPETFDLSYWNEGVKPSFDFGAQVRVFGRNFAALVDFAPWLYFALFIWVGWQAALGSAFSVRIRRPSICVLFGIIGMSGTLMFCLVLFEARYVAPFVFLGLSGLLLWPRCLPGQRRNIRAAHVGSILIAGVTVTLAITSISDQSFRALYESKTKPSHRSTFFENVAVKNFLAKQGVSQGNLIAVAGTPTNGIYWARLSGVRVNGSIADQKEFLNVSHHERLGAINALRSRGFKAIIATDPSLTKLSREGWIQVPETRNVFVNFLTSDFNGKVLTAEKSAQRRFKFTHVSGPNDSTKMFRPQLNVFPAADASTL